MGLIERSCEFLLYNGRLHSHLTPMKTFLILAAATTSISLLLPSLFAAETTVAPARIAAWNVACGRNDKGGTPIPDDRIARLGEVIATKIKPDVLVLEEVWPASASAAIAKASTDAGFPMEAVEVPPQDPDVVQLVTIIKRPGVEVKDVGLIENSNDLVDGDEPEEKTTRKAVIASVKVNQFDFYLVGVHLKSKRPSKTIAISPMEMRDRQCKTIADRLHQLVTSGKEKDILLVGDFNMTPAGQANAGEPDDVKNFETLNSHQELRFVSDDSRDKTHMGFYKGGIRRSKLDGYAIARSTEAAYVPGSFQVMKDTVLGLSERQFTNTRADNFLSDHYPIVAEFDQTKDAD